MSKLKDVEIAILNAIVEENKNDYPFLESHFPFLSVKNREYTGVGLYVNFEYSNLVDKSEINVLLSSTKVLTIENLENELTYILDITTGKIAFLEIVTNGDDILEDEIANFKLV